MYSNLLDAEIEGFEKQKKTYCGNAYDEYENLTSAIEACQTDLTCRMVFDELCDGNNTFKLCRNVDDIGDSEAGSCIYKKDGKSCVLMIVLI